VESIKYGISNGVKKSFRHRRKHQKSRDIRGVERSWPKASAWVKRKRAERRVGRERRY